MVVYYKTNKIQVICPICKTRDIIGIPESRLKKNSHLTTISIHKGLICPHHFQFFMDKNFQIRGYQKVDLELHQDNSLNLRNGVKVFNQSKNESKNNFENLIIDGNKVKYVPINDKSNEKKVELKEVNQIISNSKKKGLREIYEEFWEFIGDNNDHFLEYISKDKRRPKYPMSSDLNEMCII